MRTNTDIFNEFNQSSLKELRLVIKLGFSTPLYLTSHAGIPNIPANKIDDVIRDVSSISQRLIPDDGRSEIGSLSFSVVDAAGAVTTEFRTELAAGTGLKGITVELYRGGSGMDWTDFRLEQTQKIDKSVTFSKGAYKIQCADIQREMRKDIFDLAKTKLAAQLVAGGLTLTVVDTTDFESCTHVASFGDSPSGSFYYLKIKYSNGFEIVKATGKTATTFTGLTRGMFGTTDVTHDLPAGSGTDEGVEIEEYVYLELPAPAMAYALLTGTIIGGGTLPTRWHLGISTSLVDQPSFENIGEDWFDSSDYTKGLIFRFQSIKKTDGKRFIEREVCLLAGAFLSVGADGKLYMRRMTGVIETADYVQEIGVDNAIVHSAVKHDLTKIRNSLDIEWAWIEFPGESKPRFVRRNVLVDATSIAIHGEGRPLKMQFKGLHNDRHTFTTLINRFDSLRDRYAAPPITFTVDLLPSLNDLEVGDIVRATFPNVRDYSAAATLDRSCEIQRISISQKTGRVTAQLFGSTSKAEPIADTGAGVNSELPNGWYSSAGTEMGTLLTIDGSGILQADGILTGGTTTRTVFYYLGDFTIPAGKTLTVTGNAELRIMGVLQTNGTHLVTTGMPENIAGFIGHTYGGRGLLVGHGPDIPFFAHRLLGRNSAMPVLEIENNAGSLLGIPADMRGSGGGTGGRVLGWVPFVYTLLADGGVGGIGGGSVVTVSRGAGYGAGGKTDISGSDGFVGNTYLTHESGSGGGGSPGCLVHVLDGSQVTFPILFGNVVAKYGTSPITNGNADTQGKAKAVYPVDLGIAVSRVAYVPASRTPYPEYENENINSPYDGQSVFTANVYKRSASAPATPTADDGSYNFTTNVLTSPSGWSTTPPAGIDPLYISTGSFSIVGTTGTDSTVIWSTPDQLVRDGFSSLVLDTRDWAITVTDPMGAWDLTGGALSNTVLSATTVGPFGEIPLIMDIRGDGATNPGWYSHWIHKHTYNKDKSYIYYVWVQRKAVDTANGLYVGFPTAPGGSEVVNIAGGAATGNPYFISNQGSLMTVGKWYLAVGVIYPDGYLGTDQGVAGLYDPADGSQIYNGLEFEWRGQELTESYLRIGYFDSGAPVMNTDDGFLFTRILAYVRDGSEPSKEAIMNLASVAGNFKDIKFKRSTSAPSTPTGDNPAGWTDDVPVGQDALWQTVAMKTAAGVLIGVWSTPSRIQGLAYRGSYAAGTAYIPDDVVIYQERSYIATTATTGNAPSGSNAGNTWWDLLAGKGDTGSAPVAFTQTIAITGTNSVNLRALADANGYDGVGDATVTYTMASGITITGNAGNPTGGHGIDTGSWPAGKTISLTLKNAGTIRGGGGKGGGGGSGGGGGAGGADGGDAVYCQTDLVIQNNGTNGVIDAAGGGGGGGGGLTTGSGQFTFHFGGGGGGGAYPNGPGGSKGQGQDGSGTAGAAGTTGGGGSAGTGAATAGAGGRGGNRNETGTVGVSSASAPGGSGGTRGYAVRKNGHTVTVSGQTVTGTQG